MRTLGLRLHRKDGDGATTSLYRTRGKRLLDTVVSAASLIVLSPVLGGVAIVVRLSLGKPVIFRQSRPGLDEKPFTMYKFRTMSNARSASGELLSDGERLAAVGRVLRSTSLDELPELVNVLRGEMSIVGPRPLLVEYLPLYTERQRRRHEVRPGLTGLAQVRGRNALTWEEKFELDVEYVDRITISLDLSIVAQTFLQVLRKAGISQEGSATMETFLGSSGRAHE